MVMTRDRLSQAIMQEILEGRDVEGGVVMDLSRASEHSLHRYGSLVGNPHDKAFIVSPTAHFCSGGVIIAENAETRIPNLFAAGEICGGVHGANRIAGNALSEAFAMGAIAGRNAALKAKEIDVPELPEAEIGSERARLECFGPQGRERPSELRRRLNEVMWVHAGIMRRGEDLEEALQEIEGLKARIPLLRAGDFRELIQVLETGNMLTCAEMVCRAALLRTESRGGHYRSDFPGEDNDRWLKNITIRKQDSEMRLEAIPVSMDFMGPL